MDGVLYLTGRDIAALGVPPGRLRAALARAFRLHAEGRTHVEPKLTVAIAPGHFFQSLCAASPDPAFAATKWVGVAAENAARGLAGVNGLVILSDLATGVPASPTATCSPSSARRRNTWRAKTANRSVSSAAARRRTATSPRCARSCPACGGWPVMSEVRPRPRC